ncbi:MAG: acyl-CoA dehydrogenase [Sphingobacteriaceae bacterium]|nr:acyl-CoA dehydrogenase [Sphingobacteriaceae bacterium]
MTTRHPSTFLNPDWIKLIRSEAGLAEKKGTLTEAQLELIYQEGWFNLFAPKKTSNAEISLPDALHLEEALSWADGSLGWTVTLCGGAGWFGGFLDPELTDILFSKRTVCLGGSGAPTGTATKTQNGYRISGRWKYATGADHLTHFTANCIIKNGDGTVLEENGETLILPFVFEKEEVSLIKDWNTIGLIATASHSFEIHDLFVPSNRSFKIAAEALKVPRPIYQYPFLQFAEVTLAVNISGMALHFVDCAGEIFSQKAAGNQLKDLRQKLLTEKLSEAENKLSKARSHFYKIVNESWNMVMQNSTLPGHILEQISLRSRNLAAISHEAVTTLYPLCGLAAASPSSEINRVWRDIHTASQHSLLTFP